MNLERWIRDVPDFPKPGILFKDITPLLAHPPAFRHAVHALADFCRGRRIDAVAAAEARGFLFAAPLAWQLEIPLIPLRKPGKLPYQTHAVEYDLEYGKAALHLHIDGVKDGAHVLLLDDVLATGGTMAAGCDLIEKAGGRVAACAFVIELTFLGGRAKLPGREVFSLLKY